MSDDESNDNLPEVRRARPRGGILKSWKPINKGSLIGFADIEFASGLIISSITVHQSHGKVWCHPAGIPQLDGERRVRTDPTTGKVLYTPSLRFRDDDVRQRFIGAVLEALEDAGISVIGTAPRALVEAHR